MSREARKIRDKWRAKAWFSVVAPPYFGGGEIASIPSDDPTKLVGRVVETTLYDITGDFSQVHMKLRFQVTTVKGGQAETIFKGHEYSRDYLRSLVRRGSSRVDGIFEVKTKDNYRLRISVIAFTVTRIKTSQAQALRAVMRRISQERAEALTFDQFVQEAVLGKIASDIYNEGKKIVPLRHVGVYKSKLLAWPGAEKPVAEVVEVLEKPAV
ncbi:30S ribosomal protein S3ae [Candidatus Bathyarchaeota archaeon]|nr:30S ribosomal protein S3ae [Candidatus Bathyarchaeota archaeon]